MKARTQWLLVVALVGLALVFVVSRSALERGAKTGPDANRNLPGAARVAPARAPIPLGSPARLVPAPRATGNAAAQPDPAKPGRVFEQQPAGALFPPTSEAARAINDYLAADGEGDVVTAQAALARMRRSRGEVLNLLQDAYWMARTASAPEIHVQTLLSLATDLKSHEAAPLLIQAVNEPFREIPSDSESEYATAQTTSRFAAMEGLRDLALRGNRRAEAALFEIIESGHPLLVAEAVMLYVDAGPDRRSRQLAAAQVLPPESHYLLHTVNVERLDDMPPLPVPDLPGRPMTLPADVVSPDLARLSPRIANHPFAPDAGSP